MFEEIDNASIPLHHSSVIGSSMQIQSIASEANTLRVRCSMDLKYIPHTLFPRAFILPFNSHTYYRVARTHGSAPAAICGRMVPNAIRIHSHFAYAKKKIKHGFAGKSVGFKSNKSNSGTINIILPSARTHALCTFSIINHID